MSLSIGFEKTSGLGWTPGRAAKAVSGLIGRSGASAAEAGKAVSAVKNPRFGSAGSPTQQASTLQRVAPKYNMRNNPRSGTPGASGMSAEQHFAANKSDVKTTGDFG